MLNKVLSTNPNTSGKTEGSLWNLAIGGAPAKQGPLLSHLVTTHGGRAAAPAPLPLCRPAWMPLLKGDIST